MATLDIGSGEDTHADVNLDIVRLPEIDVQGTMDALPFADNTFDRIVLDHVLEHAEAPLETLAECWRVCEPNGIIEITVPHGMTARYQRDPTHKTSFTLRSIEHFVRDSGLPAWYGDARFEIIEQTIQSSIANQFTTRSRVRAGLTYVFNKILAVAANADPDVFEPFLVFSSYADIHWKISPVKGTKNDV